MKRGETLLLVVVACSLCWQQRVHASKVQPSRSTNEAGSSSGTSNFGQVVPEAEETIRWIREHGGQVNVIVRHTPDSGRAVFAPQKFKKGDVLAAIPYELCYLAADDVNADVQFTALKLVEDLADVNHTHQSYFVSLPPRNGVWSMHDIPRSYLPLIQSKEGALEEAISTFQERLQMLWDMAGSRSPAPGTLADLKFALAQLMTRLFQFEGVGLVMIPLVDMGNHRNDCRNTHLVEACPFDSTRKCMVWRAQHDITKGGEVCNFYKFMLNDRSLLQYGFLQGDAVSRQLSGVDRHDFNTTQPWQDLPTGEHGPLLFEGSPDDIRSEVDRLTELKASLQEADRQLTNITADAADTGGWFLSLLWQWRQQRQNNIDREVNRLNIQLHRMERIHQDRADLAARHLVFDSLTQWLEDQGAQVKVKPRVVGEESTAASTCHSPSPTRSRTQSDVPAGSSGTSQPSGQICDSGLINSTATALDTETAVQEGSGGAGVRTGVFTASAVNKGDMLAVIPLTLAHRIKDGNEGLLRSIMELLLSVHNEQAPKAAGDDYIHKPWLAAVPKLGEVQGLYSFPTEYLPLIHSKPMATHIAAMQAMLKKAWDSHRPVIEETDDSLTLQELQHMASWVTSRSLTYDEGTFLVPLMSLTSTHMISECEHYDYVDKCPGSESELCVYWVAGADMAADEEVCISYGHLTPDIAVLQYGSHLKTTQQETLALLAMDHYDFNADQPFAPLSSSGDAPRHFQGTAEQALSEAARLSLILHDLSTQQPDQQIDNQQTPVPADVDGCLLDQLQRLAEYRVAALDAEIQRLLHTHELSTVQVQQAVHALLEARKFTTSGTLDDVNTVIHGEDGDPWSKMITWMRRNGATVNVRVQYDNPTTGRVVVADKELRRGSLIAAIPLKLAFSLEHHGGNDTYELAAANLFDAMSNPEHELQPYLASLPKRDEILCPLVDMPHKYLSLIHNNIAEDAVLEYQQRIQVFWDTFKTRLQAVLPAMTLEDLKYARSLIATRVFKHSAYGEIMIPLLDMANHYQDCPHIQTLGSCPADATQECLLWHAGSNVPIGHEVCNFYKAMRNDQSFLQYGFIQADDLQLHNMDRQDYVDTTSFWSPSWRNNSSHVATMPGSRQTKLQELARLERLVSTLIFDSPPTAYGLVDQRFIESLIQWRDNRVSAINMTVADIEQQLQQ